MDTAHDIYSLRRTHHSKQTQKQHFLLQLPVQRPKDVMKKEEDFASARESANTSDTVPEDNEQAQRSSSEIQKEE